jgi:hypothetical protein
MELWRDTPEELVKLADPARFFGDAPREGWTLGDRLRETFPAYDGQRGRAALMDKLRADFPSFEKKFFNHGPASAFPALIVWLAKDYATALRSWERDGNVDADAMRPKTGPPPKPARPAADDDVDLGGA